MSTVTAPALLTPRLELRAFRPDDLDALAAIYADPGVMRYIRGGVAEGPRTREQTAASMESYVAAWAEQGYGACGFVDRAEIGYILGRAAWGKGIATEAAHACLWYGFEHLGYEVIGAGAKRENVASLRVIEKLGMRRVPNDYFDRNGGAYYELMRSEYAAPDDVSLAPPDE